jgi:hypothetical protein
MLAKKDHSYFGKTLFVLGILLIALALLVPTLYADEDSEWEARYWNNRTFSGDPVLLRLEPELDHNWGGGSPASDVNDDDFSARWKKTIDVSAGMYRFIATTDDGMRVWVGGDLVIDSWYDSQEHVVSGDVYLTEGEHRIKVEYYEASGEAVARLSWNRLPVGPGEFRNWRGQYFNNTALAGPPVLERDDVHIDFDWGAGSPVQGTVSDDQFSVRWTRDVYFAAGRYRFTTTMDDGVRLWVNNTLLIDAWQDQAEAIESAEIGLSGGIVPIRLEYYENRGLAEIHLTWTPGGAVTTPPTTPVQPEGARTASVINARHLNVRSGPGFEYDPFSHLDRGQVVELTGYRDWFTNWIQIYLPDGRRGWVGVSFLASDYPFQDLAVWSEE